ncbi:hypothetical protein SUGI_0273400 [Cryptomeria japonica]|nr:hypothetical protein SUGI_0273400 [Cryptomeria japonica]
MTFNFSSKGSKKRALTIGMRVSEVDELGFGGNDTQRKGAPWIGGRGWVGQWFGGSDTHMKGCSKILQSVAKRLHHFSASSVT